MSTSAHRVLDAARGDRAMLWVVAIMMFLTMLAAAAGIGTTRAAVGLGRDLAGRATVDVDDPAGTARVLARLRASPLVTRAEPVPAAEMARLLDPLLGDALEGAELTLPALIDVTMAAGATPAQVTALLAGEPARVAGQARALAPVTRFLAALALLAFLLVALMVAATAAVVVLSARAGLEAHGATIGIMHMLGSTDVQVARLFQRRTFRDSASGAAIGGAAGLGIVALVGWQADRVGSGLLATVTLGTGGWAALLLLLPAAFVALATFTARRSVVRALARAL